MKLSERWLRQWVNPAINREQLVAQLTMAGLEIDEALPVAGLFTDVITGEIISLSAHPDSDYLQICQVKISDKRKLQIVSAAQNIRPNLKVAVAPPGALLPNDVKVTARELRGVTSEGMLCSTAELGLTESAEGVWELPPDTPLGKDLRFWLEMDDYSFEINLTPNRGDCLSVAGIAREVAVINRCSVVVPTISAISSNIATTFPVVIDAVQDCPRYVGRVIRNINPHAATPLWMQECLRRSGIRSIMPVVDVTNYVMLELGQPLPDYRIKR
jgi:phenylalanyl-tRNA synthetase beta chain